MPVAANNIFRRFPFRRALLKAVSSPTQVSLLKNRSIGTLPQSFILRRSQWAVSPFQRRYASDDGASQAAAAVDSLASSHTGEHAPTQSSSGDYSYLEAARQRTGRDRSNKDKPPTKTVYVGNLYFEVREEAIKQLFEQCGTVVKTKLAYDHRGLSKGYAFVEFETQEAADKALDTLHMQVFMGRQMNVQYLTLRERGPPSASPNIPDGPTKTLYIGNMPFQMTDKDLNELFRQVRNVLDVRVAIDRRTGQPRGFAHADFIDIASAMEAKDKLNDIELYGRKLRVNFGNESQLRGTRDPPNSENLASAE